MGLKKYCSQISANDNNLNHSVYFMIGQKQILQQEDSSITAEMNHHLELCNGSHLSIIKGTINYHDHPKFGFCFKENLPHFLCMKGITGLVWREGSEDKTRKDRYNIPYRNIITKYMATYC